MQLVRNVSTALLIACLTPGMAHAIPAWARRYSMNCSGCHTPAVPRLNADGIAFKWAGYRMPDDIGNAVTVQKIENYIAARVIAAYDYLTSRDSGRVVDRFSVPSASLFVAGPLGKHFGAYVEFERLPDATVDLVGSISGVWGREQRYGGFRIAQGHMLMAAGGVAGFDRPTGIAMPLAYDEPTTASIPLRLGGDLAGVEGFLVVGNRNRTAVQVVNGTVVGAGEGGAPVSEKDIVVTNQLMWDDAGSGLGVAAYLGSATGLIRDQPGVSRQYYRLAATANKVVGRTEVMGGYVYGKDRDVPAGDSTATTRSPTGISYWLQGQYTLGKDRSPSVFGRYEYANADQSSPDASRQRYLLGAVVPINVPEYLRWSVELFRDTYRTSATPRRIGVSTQLQVVF